MKVLINDHIHDPNATGWIMRNGCFTHLTATEVCSTDLLFRGPFDRTRFRSSLRRGVTAQLVPAKISKQAQTQKETL